MFFIVLLPIYKKKRFEVLYQYFIVIFIGIKSKHSMHAQHYHAMLGFNWH